MQNDINKTTLFITVLHRGPLCKLNGELGIDFATLDYETSDGEWLGGGLKVASTTLVAPQDVQAECEALGNDGTFFAPWDELEGTA